MNNRLLLLVALSLTAATAARSVSVLRREVTMAQMIPPTATPALSGPGYFFSLVGACPGTRIQNVPPGETELQLNIDWSEVRTKKAMFKMDGYDSGLSYGTQQTALLFERRGSEAYRCHRLALEVESAAGGTARYSHILFAVDDPTNSIPMNNNPEDLFTFEYDDWDQVESMATPMAPSREYFPVEVSVAANDLITRPDNDAQGPPVTLFTQADSVYLIRRGPCLAGFEFYEVKHDASGSSIEKTGVFCRSGNSLALDLGSGLATGSYTASVFARPGGSPLATTSFTVVP